MPVPKGVRIGGRQKGTPNKVTSEIRAIAQKHGPAALRELARLTTEADQLSVRVAAIKELLDRGYGKSPQPITGEGGEGDVGVDAKVEMNVNPRDELARRIAGVAARIGAGKTSEPAER